MELVSYQMRISASLTHKILLCHLHSAYSSENVSSAHPSSAHDPLAPSALQTQMAACCNCQSVRVSMTDSFVELTTIESIARQNSTTPADPDDSDVIEVDSSQDRQAANDFRREAEDAVREVTDSVLLAAGRRRKASLALLSAKRKLKAARKERKVAIKRLDRARQERNEVQKIMAAAAQICYQCQSAEKKISGVVQAADCDRLEAEGRRTHLFEEFAKDFAHVRQTQHR